MKTRSFKFFAVSGLILLTTIIIAAFWNDLKLGENKVPLAIGVTISFGISLAGLIFGIDEIKKSKAAKTWIGLIGNGAVLLFFALTLAYSMTLPQEQAGKEPSLKACLAAYPDIILTVREIVTPQFYEANNLSKYEELEIDTASQSILSVKYRFKIKDEEHDFYSAIGVALSFEKNEAAAKSTYKLWQTEHLAGISDLMDKGASVSNLDHLISFGEESEFTEYRQKGELRGYHLVGRDKGVAVLFSIVSNHIRHHDFVEMFKNKIERIKKSNRR